jgi:hypothetical protein
VLALALAAALASEPFLPAVDHVNRPMTEWIEAFETSGLRDRDAMWCVYYHAGGGGSAADVARFARSGGGARPITACAWISRRS